MARQDRYAVTASLDNMDLGVFDSMSGGEGDSEETKYKPGAMGAEIVLGGSATVGNVTIGRLYLAERDSELMHLYYSRRGKGRMEVTKQPLDEDGNAFGRPVVYKGILKAVTPGDVDSTSGDADTYELEISTSGNIG